AKRTEAIAAITEDIPENTWTRLEERAANKDPNAADKNGLSAEDARKLQRMRAVADVTCDQAWREFGRLVRTWHWGVARRRRDMDGQREA
ncbi:MAG TPA: hypothetical protein PKN08_12160, partial [Opitutaceae bacterium]|nr:hypothetical protein [Opitutaceae bacterium]